MTDPRKPIFDAIKTARKNAPFSIVEVGLVDRLLDQLEVPRAAHSKPVKLEDPNGFFGAVRTSFRPLDQAQVDGFNFLLDAMGAAGWGMGWTAYGLATAWHETAYTMQPVKEAYWKSEDWRKKNLRYFPWYGRGYVQLTWEKNYEAASKALGLDLIANPDLALDHEVAARILVWGMSTGAFTKKKLGDYISQSGLGDHRQFTLARYIINGTDKAAKIADEALMFQTALALGRWG